MKTNATLPQNFSSQTSRMVAAHREVEIALNPRIMQKILSEHENMRAGLGQDEATCHILDAKYEPGKRCSILYQLDEQMIIGEMDWNGTGVTQPGPASSVPTHLQVYPYEQDPGLPALTTVLDGEKMRQILNSALPTCRTGEQQILRCQVTLLRYRLGKRCTLRYVLRLRHQQSGKTTKRVLYGKLYHSATKAEAVHQEMQMLSTDPAMHGQGLVVAEAALYVPSLPMVLQEPVADNVPLELLLEEPPNAVEGDRSRTADAIRGAAVALAELHKSALTSTRVRAVGTELVRIEQRCARVLGVEPETGEALHTLAQALPAWLPQLAAWDQEIGLVHGDCKPSQFFIMEDGQTALLDFDHCGMADPAADVGNFLATLRQMGAKQVLKQRDPAVAAKWQAWLACLEEIFLDTYLATRDCGAGFRKRAVWYQAMALLRKAYRSFARSTRSPLPSLLVQEAWARLATLEPAGKASAQV